MENIEISEFTLNGGKTKIAFFRYFNTTPEFENNCLTELDNAVQCYIGGQQANVYTSRSNRFYKIVVKGEIPDFVAYKWQCLSEEY